MDSSWYESCMTELRLPGSPWHSVFDLIGETLAYRIRLEGLTYDQLNRVSKFVGDQFMKKYHLSELFDTHKPDVVRSTKLATDSEVQQFLKDLTIKSANACGCILPVTESSDKNFLELINLVRNTCQKNFHSLEVSVDEKSREQKRELLGQTLVEILKSDASRMNYVLSRVEGKPMPRCLRQYLYKLLLLNRTKKSLQYAFPEAESSMKKLRLKFASAIKNGMLELRISKTSDASLAQLISSSVATVFKSSPSLQSYVKDEAFQQQCCRVLNILYIRKRQFNATNILWLMPLLVTFKEQNYSKELDYELAMWLSVLIDQFGPSVKVANEIALSTWRNALKHSSKLKAFETLSLKSILHSFNVATDEDTIRPILANTTLRDISTHSYQSLHVILLIRQWVMHLFVGRLDLSTTLFIWDQLFLNDWSPSCFVRSCLVLFYCLADHIKECRSKTQLLDLFSKNTADIQYKDFVKHWKNFANF